MLWTTVWVFLLLGALTALGLCLRALWHAFMGVVDELDTALGRLDAACEPQDPSVGPFVPELAPLADPMQMRARLRALRLTQSAARRPRHRAR